ncbi:MAG: hypothetical protein ACOCXG_04620 [Nanoarchaeota archaeon]
MAKDEEINEVDLIFETNDRLDALVELLVEKGVISEGDYYKKLQEIIDRNSEV